MKGEALKGHLDLLILAVLQAGPLHGYAAIEALRRNSGGVFNLPEGTIYPALHRLELGGLLASQWSEHEGRRRRVYRLTRSGRAALSCDIEQWATFARAVAAVVGATG
ncbi:MAG: helix-turn-helix transcriptional regulator [Planctomycetes bacterium]|nr:helix-turn-helix transcriptional regulator [Planctomycetota bacterium]